MAMADANSNDPDPVALENMRRMAYDRSKWLQTCTSEIAKYEYSKEELNQFYDQLKDVIGRARAKFNCGLCGSCPKKTFVIPCGHCFCAKCASRSWNQQDKSKCPICKTEHEESVRPFFAMDIVVAESAQFIKEAKYFQNTGQNSLDAREAAKRLKSMNFVLLQRLKNIESQLMCDFCFNKIKKTFLINCASDAFAFRPFCEGCDAKYVKFYETELHRTLKKPFRFEVFDSVVNEFYEFLHNVVEYSKTSKVPTRFMASNGAISLLPIYKMLVGFALLGLVMLYYSS